MPAVPAHRDADARADAAEAAIVERHLRRLWALPLTSLGVVGWPPVRRERLFGLWHYWWQAHLLDCAVDAADRAPTPQRRRRVVRIARTHRLRNRTGWTNNYYDDMAWLALALERAQLGQSVAHPRAIARLEGELYRSWAPEIGGGIPWRIGSDFYNTPANGPAGILLARTGKLWRAEEMADWIDATLRDPETGLIFDGIHLRPDGSRELATRFYTYCQGVALGLETELAVQVGDRRHNERIARLVAAVDEHLTTDGVIVGCRGGDGGLFSGILARYLAVVAAVLPVTSPADVRARDTAARLVRRSADAAWANTLTVDGLPIFGHDWTAPAVIPGAGETSSRDGAVNSSDVPERNLSVQLSGWMLMEAAARLARIG